MPTSILHPLIQPTADEKLVQASPSPPQSDPSDSESEDDGPSLLTPLTCDLTSSTQLSSLPWSRNKPTDLLPQRNTPSELDSPRQLLTAREIGDAYFEARLKKVEFARWVTPDGDGETYPACLILIEANFQPKNSSKRLRFRDATVEVEFDDAPPGYVPPSETTTSVDVHTSHYNYTGPTILHFSPSISHGPQSTSTPASFTISVNPLAPLTLLSAGAPLPNHIRSLSPNLSYTHTPPPRKGTQIIHGILKQNPPKRIVWKLNENGVDKDGILRRYNLAAVVRYTPGRGRFAMFVRMKATMNSLVRGGVGVGDVVRGARDEPIYFTPGVCLGRQLGEEEVAAMASSLENEIVPPGPAVTPPGKMSALDGGSIEVGGKAFIPKSKAPSSHNEHSQGERNLAAVKLADLTTLRFEYLVEETLP